MTRLILTTSDSGAGALIQAGIADIVIPFGLRLVCGLPPADAEFATFLAARSAKDASRPAHWPDNFDRGCRGEIRRAGLGLIELCELCDTVELWIDPDPNAQLILIQLLDYFRSQLKFAAKLTLIQVNSMIGNKLPDGVAKWRRAAVEVSSGHLEAASRAWQAYRQPTPQDWSSLVDQDLSMLPQLGQAVLELLEELRSPRWARPFWRGPRIFSRHNPIHRWWGGTELTSDRLWRWDSANRALIAPQR